MGSLISTSFYLHHAAPAGQTPVLSHVGIPQEATLHEGQRSGEKGKAARQRRYSSPSSGQISN